MTAVPHLARTQDNSFFFVAAAKGRLEIQRCSTCQALRHPPTPVCSACRSFDWDTVVSTRMAALHSWTVLHHPKDPSFEYPMAVGLVDLEEGTRLVAAISGHEHDDLAIDMELEVGFTAHAHGEILPRLYPRGAAQGVPR